MHTPLSIILAHAAVILTAAFTMSLLYELWRATAKAGVSEHDSLRGLLGWGVPFYGIAAVVIAILWTGQPWAAWVGFVYSIAMILLSIFYYNPKIMLARKPGLIDWFEDLTYTGLLFIVAAILLFAILRRMPD